MKVKKEKTHVLSISEVNNTYVIIVKYHDDWHIMQADTFEGAKYRLLALANHIDGHELTVKNTYGIQTINEWFDTCQEMHAFKTTKEAFEFLIKKL